MSPKRKRSSVEVPSLETVILDQDRQDDPSSPRTKVANDFCGLNIRGLEQQHSVPSAKKRHTEDSVTGVVPPLGTALATPPSDRPIRPALYTQEQEQYHDGGEDMEPEIGETPGAYDFHHHDEHGEPLLEISQHPQYAYGNGACFPSSPPVSPSPSPSHAPLMPERAPKPKMSPAKPPRGPAITATGRRKAKAATQPITVPPPPTPIVSPSNEEPTMLLLPLAPPDRTISPMPTNIPRIPDSGHLSSRPHALSQPTLPNQQQAEDALAKKASRQDCRTDSVVALAETDPFPLTWQDSEITGHLLDDPEDDGEGINGLGFRPTPAMASARSEKRRQQVTEWRAREAREERRRRAEDRKKKRGSGDCGIADGRDGVHVDGEGGAKRRLVRFAELA